MKELIIKPNLLKQIKWVFECTFMLIPFLFLCFAKRKFLLLFIKYPLTVMLLRVLGLCGVLFFGVALFLYIKDLLFPKGLLILTEEGFVDNSTAVSGKFVPWSMVSSCYLIDVVSQKLISIELINEEQYINTLSPIKKLFAKMNVAIGYTAISINPNSMTEHIDDIFLLIETYLNYYRDTHPVLSLES